jgi:hypothetical protein
MTVYGRSMGLNKQEDVLEWTTLLGEEGVYVVEI